MRSASFVSESAVVLALLGQLIEEGQNLTTVERLLRRPEYILDPEELSGKLQKLFEGDPFAGLRIDVLVVSVLDCDAGWYPSGRLPEPRIAVIHLRLAIRQQVGPTDAHP